MWLPLFSSLFYAYLWVYIYTHTHTHGRLMVMVLVHRAYLPSSSLIFSAVIDVKMTKNFAFVS